MYICVWHDLMKPARAFEGEAAVADKLATAIATKRPVSRSLRIALPLEFAGQ
jgi:hypothetical protein